MFCFFVLNWFMFGLTCMIVVAVVYANLVCLYLLGFCFGCSVVGLVVWWLFVCFLGWLLVVPDCVWVAF